MNATVDFETRPDRHTVFAPCELSLAACELQATRLRSWALIRGETITGLPFLRLRAGGETEVHLPVSGTIAPHSQVGVTAEETPESTLAVVHDVAFGSLPNVLQEVGARIAADHSPAGAAEFHPAGREAWKIGTLAWPVREAPGVGSRVAISA